MNKDNKKLTCKLCGIKYEGCVTCMKSKDTYYSWRNVCCSTQHFGIYETLVDYVRENITKEQARKVLANRVADLESYADVNKRIIKEILREEPKVEATKKAEPVVAKPVHKVEKNTNELTAKKTNEKKNDVTNKQ